MKKKILDTSLNGILVKSRGGKLPWLVSCCVNQSCVNKAAWEVALQSESFCTVSLYYPLIPRRIRGNFFFVHSFRCLKTFSFSKWTLWSSMSRVRQTWGICKTTCPALPGRGDEESGCGCQGLTAVAFTKVFKGQCFENKNILDRVGHRLQNANGKGCFVMIRKESY